MKINFVLSSTSLVLAGFLMAGCSKQEDTSTPAASQSQPPTATPAVVDNAQKTADSVAGAAQDEAGKAKTAVTEAVKPAEEVKPPAPGAGGAGGATQVQAVLRQAKVLYSEKKYTEAAAALGQLSNVTLSADEQKMVEQMKTQIQNALASQTASEGASAVGGLLNKKK